MKPLLLFCLLIAYCHLVNAQKDYLEIGTYYSKAKLRYKFTGTIKAHSVTQLNDSVLEYTTKKYGVIVKHQVETQYIEYVLVKKGNYALEMGTGVGVLLLAGGLVDYLQLKSHNPDINFGEDVWVMAGLVAGGVVIGTLAGALTPRYATFYVYEKPKLAVRISPKLNSHYLGVCMQLSF